MRKHCLILLLGIAIGVLVSLPFRSRGGAPTPQPADASSLAERELERVIPHVDIEELPFDRAVAEVQKLTNVEIIVDRKTLQQYAFNANVPISIHGTAITLGDVLGQLTDSASSGQENNSRLTFQPSHGQIAILSADLFWPIATGRVYDVQDLLQGLRASPICGNGAESYVPTHEEKLGELVGLLQNCTDTGGWIPADGGATSIKVCGNAVYVTANWATHRKIQIILQQLRTAQPPPIAKGRQPGAFQAWAIPEISAQFDAIIHRPVARIDIDNVSLDQAVVTLRKAFGVPIFINRASLAKASFSPQSRITIHAIDVSLSDALERASADPVDGIALGFTIEQGCAVICSRDVADTHRMTRVYDIRDILEKRTPGATLVEEVEQLASILTNDVTPESWENAGGTIGSIRELNGRFIVTQTWANHQRIAAILNSVRKTGITPSPQTQSSKR